MKASDALVTLSRINRRPVFSTELFSIELMVKLN
jgi:hypothetical protein